MTEPMPALVLAAGASSRMGTVKSLLHWKGQTVLGHILGEVRKAGFIPLVVTGAHGEEVQTVLAELEVASTFNPHWALGMGSSIRCGMKAVREKSPQAPGVLILVCDQPLISEGYLREVVRVFREGGHAGIVASRYPDGGGVPALFSQKYWDALLYLPDAHGARKLIARETQNVSYLDPGEASADMDTPESYNRLLEQTGQKLKT
ncbi:nucleotidyltransferase family protein [Robiginitalea sediminis]|uniref:nucleotidyltransferase family protein n=1 Tax=Robiginitalea sediminis TaxID=1982593 RepID=UPI000B4B561F|nr:nucleotidyltransferase family protein [Robiginitalea sediminis]